jgi:hypothetical protein
MSDNRDLTRRLADFYAGEAPSRAPDWVLRESLAAIETTKQPRLLIGARRRIYLMSTNLKVAAAVVAVVALGIVTWQLLSGPGGTGGEPTPTPLVTPSPSPTPPVTPSPTPEPTAPPLTGTHASELFGLSVSYPAGWTVVEAAEPWTTRSVPSFIESSADTIHDPILRDHLFIVLTSEPLNGESGQTWADALAAEPDPGPCLTFDAVVVGGLDGRLYSCNLPLRAFFWSEDRGYLVAMYRSNDEVWLEDVYDLAWFNEVLGTVQVQ